MSFRSGVQVRRKSIDRRGRAAYKLAEERIHVNRLTGRSSLLDQDQRSKSDTCEASARVELHLKLTAAYFAWVRLRHWMFC